MLQEYKSTYQNIQGQLDELYRKYAENDTLSTTEMYRFNRLNNLQNNIKQQVRSLGENEETFLGKSLYQNFQDVSQQTVQYINKTAGLDIDFSYIDDKFIESAIKQNWQGGNFSSRIWDNKDKLLKNINSTIVDGIASGQSINDMAADLKNAMGVGAYDALRLARTETMHCLNNGQTDSFKKAGYSKVIWIAAQDELTCETCGDLDGQSFDIDDAPDCPAHPNCRCTLAADPDSLNDDSSNDDTSKLDSYNNSDSSNDENNSEDSDSNNENSDTMNIQDTLENLGIKGTNIPVEPMNITDIDQHAFDRFDQRKITKEDAQGYIDNAKTCISVWNGQVKKYFSADGASYITIDGRLQTAYPKENFDEKIQKMMEMIKKNDK